MEMRVSLDPEARTLTISDTGVGMTKKELIENLGTVAKSGTTNFMEMLGEQQGGDDSAGGVDLSMIGQFGVGFYSIYLVSDRVTVASKSNNDPKQHIWVSSADGSFSVKEDPRGDTLGRGTEITLYLKDDASEFLESYRLKELVKKYSEFITFPIYLREESIEIREVEEDEEEDTDEMDIDEDSDDDDIEVTDEDEVEDAVSGEQSGEPLKQEIVTYQWVRANDNVAIWAREKEDVTDQEYREFYENLAKDGTQSNQWIHFKAEGEVEFKGILYVPEEGPHDMYDKYYEKQARIRLYVKKVLITDEFTDLVPNYLNFVKGVIDSDDLPLNVNRETLQQSKILKVMGKKIVRKTLEMIKKIANEDFDPEDEEANKEMARGVKPGQEKKHPYIRFWEEFGKSIKLGVIEDSSNRSKLIKLLRFKTTKSKPEDWDDDADKNGPRDDGYEWRSLEDYVAGMHEWQENIYWVAGESLKAIEQSPFLEQCRLKNVEVLLLTDPIDEYAIQHIPEFEGKRLMSISKEGLKFGDEDPDLSERRLKAYEKKFEPLTDFLNELYNGGETYSRKKKINKVAVSTRLTTTPSVLVTGQYGNSAKMERIMRAQAFSDRGDNNYLMSSRSMEINPRHPLIVTMLEQVMDDTEDQKLKDNAMVLLDTASLSSGFPVDNVEEFSDRMYRVLSKSVGVEEGRGLEDEIEVPEEEEEEEDSSDGVEVNLEDLVGGDEL